MKFGIQYHDDQCYHSASDGHPVAPTGKHTGLTHFSHQQLTFQGNTEALFPPSSHQQKPSPSASSPHFLSPHAAVVLVSPPIKLIPLEVSSAGHTNVFSKYIDLTLLGFRQHKRICKILSFWRGGHFWEKYLFLPLSNPHLQMNNSPPNSKF